MKVLHAPFFKGNQYQEELVEALSSRDIVSLKETTALPFTPILTRLLFEDIDVLHLHWLHPYFLLGSKQALYRLPLSRVFCVLAAVVFTTQVTLARLLCRKIVWTAHNRCNHERRYANLDKWVTRRVASKADAIQVWDDATREELAEYLDRPLNNSYIIPHGNYYDRYDSVDQVTARNELGIPENIRVYLYFGVVRPYKGVPDLVDIFDGKDSSILLIAGNPKDEQLETRIREQASGRPDIRLEFGYIPEEKVAMYFAAADAVVLPYRHIFNSGSVLLAMSLERLVVAPALGSIPTVLPDGNVVYENLSEGLKCVYGLSDDHLMDIGQQNLEVALSNHEWGTIADQTLTMYTDDKLTTEEMY